ncbi:MAG: hypothetical protein K0S09_343 [Sphingobacteriaceae bacterium]|jgi:maltose/maltodextrin transport system substrate-binding protein|nr:hypothetical protein [Sphingobacteriaceae bacterium]
MNKKTIYVLIAFAATVAGCKSLNGTNTNEKSLGEIAKQESATPIRPGKPGVAPFWNAKAHQFIYAPAFDYKLVPGAVKYQYKVRSLVDSSDHNFESDVPYTPLSKIWTALPIGFFTLEVNGLSATGANLGTAGKGKYYHAAYFNGPYYEPVMPYDKSAMIALDTLFNRSYVNYWYTHKVPDPDYVNYRYPAKIISALVIGAVTYARLKPNTPEATRSTELAKTIADYLLSIRYPKGSAWEYFVPTYYGPRIGKDPKSHMQLTNNFTIMGVDAGNAFLDLYNLNGDKKYLEAAKQIAQTYLKTQLPSGTWYQFVNYQTGEPTAPNLTIPTSIINYLGRMTREYKMDGLENATTKAVNWVMENPVKTFNWQGQFEDVYARPPYENLAREQACDMAVYLFTNKKDFKLADELLRFSEDQFIIWEKPVPITIGKYKGPSYNSNSWITPNVLEQYVYWMPVGRSAGVMVDAYHQAYKATHNEMYLAKAKAIANAFTLNQKLHNGNYDTYFTKYVLDGWLNSTVYPAKVLMNLQNDLKKN